MIPRDDRQHGELELVIEVVERLRRREDVDAGVHQRVHGGWRI